MLDATTILIVDNYPSVRNGLRALIETASDMVVVGDAYDCATAVQLAYTLQPDVIILDMMSASQDGIGIVRAIRRSSPRSQILILTGHERCDQVEDIFREGVRGYLLKDPLAANITAAIHAVLDGKLIIHRGIAHAVSGSSKMAPENYPDKMPEIFPT
jgi:DNA-binding NarL/FixJ family response regulator